ncbi:MAG: type IV pilus assembly protein PilM [Thermoleophilia bacterium]
MPPVPVPKETISGSGHKAHKPPRSEREQKAPSKPPSIKKKKPVKGTKGPRKPLFGFGRKKMPPMSPLTASPAPGAADTEKTDDDAVLAPQPTEFEKPHGRLFGRGDKPARAPRQKKVKEPKAPRQKKVKEPKAPREKKVKQKRVPGEPGLRKSGRKPRGGGGKSSVVGLDLGRTSITAVQLKYQSGGVAMLSASVDRLPEGLIQEGEVQDVDELALALKDFWKKNHIRGKKVSLGLANQKVVVRSLDFPMLEKEELRTAIEFQAQDYIPIPIEEAVFDYHVLGQTTDEEGVVKQKVLVVAAQKVMVMDFIDALKKAKLGIGQIDLQAFAMLRALAPKSSFDASPAVGAVAIANIGSDVTNIVVETGGEPQFTRIVAFGGDNFTNAVQEFMGITFVEADTLKTELGLPLPGERLEGAEPISVVPPVSEPSPYDLPMETETTKAPPPGPASGPPLPADFEGVPFMHQPMQSDEVVPESEPPMLPEPEADAGEIPDEGRMVTAEIQRVLEITADALADEIRRSLDYYQSQEFSAPISQLILSGGGAMLKNLDKHLSQIFPFEVVVGNPMSNVTQNRTGIEEDVLKNMSPRLAIAIGLALEDED